jgi:hypothetical protein
MSRLNLRLLERVGAVQIPSAYNPSISACDKPSIVARISVVSSPIDGAPRQICPGVSDTFGSTPNTRIGTPD